MLMIAVASGLAAAQAACSGGGDADTATGQLMGAAPSVLVDLDPASAAMTFTGDRESGNVLRIDRGGADLGRPLVYWTRTALASSAAWR